MSTSRTFASRETAGRTLAEALAPWRSAHPVVMGIPPGGMLVAHEVATHLHAPLDVLPVCEINVPLKADVVLGAAAPEAMLLDSRVARESGLRRRVIDLMMCRAMATVGHMEMRYRGRHREMPLAGRTVIVVTDGIASTTTVRLALMSVWRRLAREVILAVPVAAAPALDALKGLADHTVCLSMPATLPTVASAYATFPDVDAHQVHEALDTTNLTMAEAIAPASVT